MPAEQGAYPTSTLSPTSSMPPAPVAAPSCSHYSARPFAVLSLPLPFAVLSLPLPNRRLSPHRVTPPRNVPRVEPVSCTRAALCRPRCRSSALAPACSRTRLDGGYDRIVIRTQPPPTVDSSNRTLITPRDRTLLNGTPIYPCDRTATKLCRTQRDLASALGRG